MSNRVEGSAAFSKKNSAWRTLLLRTIALIFALLLGLYGLFAIDMARIISSPLFTPSSEIVAKRHATNQAANAGVSNEYTSEAWKHSGVWLYGLSQLTSDKHAYGDDSYFTYSMFHYAEMPKKNILMLSFHNVMGGLCMLFGALQFWPTFRKKFPRWHRCFGMIYMITAQLAMIGAAIYLYITPVKTIYDSFSFYIGLCLLAAIVTLSLWMSIYHLIRREYAQHQAFMAINFGALLTAPLLRYNWVLGGILFPEVSFNTANYWGAGILLPQCFIIGYLLLCVSRSLQQDRPQPLLTSRDVPAWRYGLVGILMAVLIAALLTTVYYFYIAPDLSHISHSSMFVPHGFAEIYRSVIVEQSSLRILFILSVVLSVVIGLAFLWNSFLDRQIKPIRQRKLAWGLVITGYAGSMILFIWAYQLGAPSVAILSGGTHAGLYGVLWLLFSSLLAIALYQHKQALITEWGLLTILISVSMPVFFWILHLLMWLPIPHEFAVQGQVFRLAADAGPALLLVGLVYTVYSQATLSKFAR
jgi:uncharacterized membrane protein YqgA involved in biofilm formation